LGTAHLADQATEEQRKALRTAREARARALKADLKAAEKLRRSRYTAVTVPASPSPRSVVTAEDAEMELTRARQTDLAARALPDLIPPREPPASWARPVSQTNSPPAAPTTVGQAEAPPPGPVPAGTAVPDATDPYDEDKDTS